MTRAREAGLRSEGAGGGGARGSGLPGCSVQGRAPQLEAPGTGPSLWTWSLVASAEDDVEAFREATRWWPVARRGSVWPGRSPGALPVCGLVFVHPEFDLWKSFCSMSRSLGFGNL